jgi:hypothetical protein
MFSLILLPAESTDMIMRFEERIVDHRTSSVASTDVSMPKEIVDEVKFA